MEARLPAPKSVPSYWTLHDLKTKLENQKVSDIVYSLYRSSSGRPKLVAV